MWSRVFSGLIAWTLLPAALGGGGNVPTRTIIDVLSSTPEFSTLVELLQARDMVNLVNRSRNSTFLAPVNSAFSGISLDMVSRETLLYHFLESPVIVGDENHKQDLLVPTYLKMHGDSDESAVNVHIRGELINNGQSEIVETDLMASPQRGVVQAVSRLLVVPDTLCSAAFEHDEITFFAQLINLGSTCSPIGAANEYTVFAPHNSVFAELDEIQKRYLFSGFGIRDRNTLIKRHFTRGVLDPRNIPDEITMLDGHKISIAPNMTVDGHYNPVESWVVAADGVLNVYSHTFGEHIVEYTPEKYIYGFNSYNFAREIKLYGYERLINGSETGAQTILVPARESSLDEVSADAQTRLKLSRSVSTETILYQFLDEQLTINATVDERRLVNTKMLLASGKHPQRATYQMRHGNTAMLNWQQITSDPYILGNTTIYLVDSEVPQPPSLALAVGPLFLSSYSLGFLEDLGLLTLPLEDSWTLLLPTREAWEKEFLLKSYFDQNPHALKRVFNNLIMRSPVYSDGKPSNVTLLDGSRASVNMNGNETLGHYSFEIDGVDLHCEIVDILFDNGVVHCVDELYIPPEIEITAHDLISAGGRGEFVQWLEAFGLDHVLRTGSNYTVFVPDLEKLKEANYTMETPNTKDVLLLHILEGNPSHEMFKGRAVTTMANEDLRVRRVSEQLYSVSPTASRGQRAFISSWAQTKGSTASGSTVLYLDSYISPDWIKDPYVLPPFRIHTHTLLLVGIVIGLMLMCVIIVSGIYLFTDTKSLDNATSDPELVRSAYRDDPFDGDDEHEDPQPTQAIRATHVSEDREFGRHLDLP